MAETDPRAAYDARCAEVAKAAASHGLTLTKVAGKHELQIARGAASVVCPIVTDEADWHQTTPEEAFYAVMLDVKTWHGVKTDAATLGALDQAESAEVPEIVSDTSAEGTLYAKLADLCGSEADLNQILALIAAS